MGTLRHGARMAQSAVSIEEVWKTFRLYQEKNNYLKTALLRGRRARYDEFLALKDVSMEIEEGSTFGIVGSNGSGKSTLLKCLVGILTPDKGRIVSRGRIAALLELGAGFHPDLSGRENIYLNGAILGMTHSDIDRNISEIVEFSGLGQFIDMPVKTYSSGMVVRLGFSVATNVDPDILVIDEVLAVGDESFQQRCYERMEQFKRDGKTIVIVSHGLAQVAQLCSRTAWLDHGVVRQVGPTYEVIREYAGESHTAQKLAQGTGKRWGSGEVTVESVHLTNLPNGNTERMSTGAPVEIAIDYHVHEKCDHLVVGLSISTLQGIGLFASNTKRRSLPISPELGPGRISFRVDDFPLLEGVYSVTVVLSDDVETHEYDHWEDGVRFSVDQGAIYDGGLIRIDGAWVLPTG